jgi:hypothetical protein
MLRKTTLAIAVATLGVAFAGAARAQVPDVRQEDRQLDRQEDRQADRREDRREDRQEDRREDRQEDRREEARFSVPRKADGTIDLPALDAEIRAALAGGARDVRIRERDLSAQDRQALADLAQRIGADLKLERVRVRQDRDRVRIELRPERVARMQKVDRPDRAERAERAERPERAERAERAERVERPDRSGRH